MTSEFDTFIRRWGSQATFVRTPDGVQLHNAGQPLYDSMSTEFKRIGSFNRSAKRIRHKSFVERLDVANPNFWIFDKSDILDAKEEFGNQSHLEKFSWNPVTGEFLLISPGQQHTTVRGKAPFDDYIRGIILRSRKTVAFRTWWPSWVRSSPYDDMDAAAFDLNYDGMEACEAMLKKHGGTGWTYQYNIDNRQLQQLTGIRRW